MATMLASLRQTLLKQRQSLRQQLGFLGRLLLAGGLLSLSISILLFVALVSGAAGALVIFLAVLQVLSLLALGLWGTLAVQLLVDRVIMPIEELASRGRRVAAGDLLIASAPQESTELQQIDIGLTSLAAAVSHERGKREAERSHGETQNSMLRQVLRLAKELGNSLNVEQILSQLGDGAAMLGGYAEATVWLVDEGERKLSAAWSNRTPEQSDLLAPRAVGDDFLGRAVTSAQTTTQRSENGPGLAVPLLQGLSVSGVLELQAPTGKGPLMADALDAIETLVSHAATALAAARLHEEVELRSETDGLTRVFNRRRLEADLRDEVARSVRYNRPLSLAMIDVDHFKAINDDFSHQKGDEVLKLVAATIGRRSRETDSAYRYGGEEFVLLLRETESAAAAEISERLRQRIIEASRGLGLSRRVTASIGVASISATVRSPEQLISAADAALYQAKTGGRDRVVLSPAN